VCSRYFPPGSPQLLEASASDLGVEAFATIQLKPTPDQAKSLHDTPERCNAACNEISKRGLDAGKTRKFGLQELLYRSIREEFGLTAQAVIRCIGKVADAYTTQTANKREGLVRFRELAAQPYDDRIFRFVADNKVSIWTLAGRHKIPFVCDERARVLLSHRKGEVDLMLVRGKCYLACVCDVADPDRISIEDVLGVDFGIVNLAFDSQRRPYTGAAVEKVRQRLSRRRAGLQRCGSKAAKPKLKKLSGKEARFRKHANHCISKEIVANAKRSRCAIAIEDLTHIRSRVKATRAQRSRLHGWSFSQLRRFVTYKARLSGVPVIAVDPRNTRRCCPECGFNRKTQQTFSCAVRLLPPPPISLETFGQRRLHL
jgi:IS605 OrfB family transposase